MKPSPNVWLLHLSPEGLALPQRVVVGREPVDVLRDLPRRSHAPLVVRAQGPDPVKDLVWTVYNILLAERCLMRDFLAG